MVHAPGWYVRCSGWSGRRTIPVRVLSPHWYRWEAFRDEQGRPREKVKEYFGESPRQRQFPLNSSLARKVAVVVAELLSLPPTRRSNFKDLGLDDPSWRG